MKVKPVIELFDIKNPRLQHIFNKESDDLEKSFADFKMQVDPAKYRYEVLLCFWFGIQRLALEESQVIYKLDKVVHQCLKSLRTKG